MTLSGCVDNLSWTGVRNQGLARSTRRLISGRRHCVGTYVRERKRSSAESLPVMVGNRRFSLLPPRFRCECWSWRIANLTEPPALAVLLLSLLTCRNKSEEKTVRATLLSLSPTTSLPSSFKPQIRVDPLDIGKNGTGREEWAVMSHNLLPDGSELIYGCKES